MINVVPAFAALPPDTITDLPSVSYVGLKDGLVQFTAQLAMIHRLTFGIPLVITSAVDGQHTAGSLHPQGRAIDIRTSDKDAEANQLLILMLAFAATRQPVAYFDERQLAGEPHIHIEWHGA